LAPVTIQPKHPACNETGPSAASIAGGTGTFWFPEAQRSGSPAPRRYADPVMSIEFLLRQQNRDGGWPYVTGASWTEPTVFAAMAASAAHREEAVARGVNWLRRHQRVDGGWAPQAGVEESTWVTALAALLPPEQLGPERHRRAISWLVRLTGCESSPVYRLRQFLLGITVPPDQSFHGWPWYPGTAAWVGPTAFGILALQQEYRRRPTRGISERLDLGRRFLLARMCREGGWNHGSARVLGCDAHAYPETTGLALLALRGVQAPQVDRALEAAQRFLSECRSADGINWLRFGLTAHARLPAGYCPPALPFRTVRDASLAMLADEGAAGRNPFFTSL
jgi:squalene-hopene cyclase-like protein